MSKKHKNAFTALNYMIDLIILASGVTGCVSTSAFASLVGIPIGIGSTAVALKMCALTAAFKKYNPITRKKSNKHNKIVLLATTKLQSIEDLSFRALIDSHVSHYDFDSINYVQRAYDGIEEAIKKFKDLKKKYRK